MATTYTFSGQLTISGFLQALASGDVVGSLRKNISQTTTYTDSGGTEPDLSGYLSGSGSISGSVDMLLAHATDPFQGAGDAVYAPSSFAPSGAAKLKMLYIRNTTAVGGGNLTITRGAANGLPIFEAAGDAVKIPPQGDMLLNLHNGSVGGTITTGSNDKLTVAPSSGTVTFELVAAYGP